MKPQKPATTKYICTVAVETDRKVTKADLRYAVGEALYPLLGGPIPTNGGLSAPEVTHVRVRSVDLD